MKLASICTFVVLTSLAFAAPPEKLNIPHLARRGNTTQLIVDGKPFLMLAAELHNSSSSSLEYMQPIWPKLADLPLNTVLTPLSWELIEPTEGKFDFALIDGLIEQARQNHLRIVFLWLASWKNGMSSYAPVWVKEDTARFPRVVERTRNPVEILSTFGRATMEADARAFAAVMRHIREVDGQQHTVLMMQVENEVGVLGDSRDRSEAANKAFESAVPDQLLRYIRQHRETLFPDFRELWEAAGARMSGTWEQVFGVGPRTDQLFMAWNYGRFVNYVAAAGKAEYALPMYVNTWLGALGTPPGVFPSGGPLPEVIDAWRASGAAIDIYAPDLYAPNFINWCERYHRAGNPLFIPETRGGAAGKANVFYAVGEHQALGFSPFGIDSWSDTDNELGKAYRTLAQLWPLLSREGIQTRGFLLDRERSHVTLALNGYQLDISLDEIFGSRAQSGYGLIAAVGPNEFVGAGAGFRVSFTPNSAGPPNAGIGFIEEGAYDKGAWKPGRRLNGDENDQGQFWRFAPDAIRIEKVVVYRFR